MFLSVEGEKCAARPVWFTFPFFLFLLPFAASSPYPFTGPFLVWDKISSDCYIFSYELCPMLANSFSLLTEAFGDCRKFWISEAAGGRRWLFRFPVQIFLGYSCQLWWQVGTLIMRGRCVYLRKNELIPLYKESFYIFHCWSYVSHLQIPWQILQ